MFAKLGVGPGAALRCRNSACQSKGDASMVRRTATLLGLVLLAAFWGAGCKTQPIGENPVPNAGDNLTPDMTDTDDSASPALVDVPDAPPAEIEEVDPTTLNLEAGTGAEGYVAQDAPLDQRSDAEFEFDISALAANPIPLVVGDTTISADSIVTRSGWVTNSEWAAMASNPKVVNLIAKANSLFGATLRADPARGFTTSLTVRYTKGGFTAPSGARITIVPLIGVPTRGNRGASAAIMIATYVDTPALVIPRLLVRSDPKNWHVTEFSFHREGRVMEMAAKHGDCLVRSSLKILEQRNTSAHNALRAALNATTGNGRHVIDGLRRVYDVNQSPVGQPELILTTAVMTSTNAEEEYDAGYISGTLDQSFKPAAGDSWWKEQAKKLLNEIKKALLNELGKILKKTICSLFGFSC